MRRTVIGLLVAGMLSSGCTGSFLATRKVYNFHRSQSDKWMDEVLFLVVALLPVYSLASFADAVIFNTIEFWTGKNPVESAKAGTGSPHQVVRQGGREVTVAYAPETDRILLTAPGARFTLERTAEGVVAKGADGAVLLSSVTTPEGGVEVRDAHAQVVRSYSAGQVSQLKEASRRN